ncbi:MAG: hypothetical protein ABR909_04205 [Candidatus Bathyarchaeia archaeon]|jgi:hypothetical protein
MTKDWHKIDTPIASTPKGNWHEVWRWYSNLEKDEELANNVDMAVERMRRGLELHRVRFR